MKKLTIITLALLTFGSANAQKIKETAVPAAVKAKFKSLYPTVTKAEWVKEDANYEASFDQGKNEYSVVIDPAGNLKETEIEIVISALPKGVAEYITKNYKGYKIADAAKITDVNGKVAYEAAVSKLDKEMDLIFDENGKFIKEQKD